uniref:hypothetical protein n=1 Tax=Pseudomonas tremae TaxID=200454 RepID=UPI001F1F3279
IQLEYLPRGLSTHSSERLSGIGLLGVQASRAVQKSITLAHFSIAPKLGCSYFFAEEVLITRYFPMGYVISVLIDLG